MHPSRDPRSVPSARPIDAARQLSLGLDLPQLPVGPRITENLFLALVPDDQAKRDIAALATRLRRDRNLTGKWVAPECLHVSLQSLGAHAETRPDLLAAGKRIGAILRAAPFRLSFNRVVSFSARGGQRPPVLQCSAIPDALSELRQAIQEQMKAEGLGHYVARPFAPHVTLLYRKEPIDPIDIDPITWVVRDLVLIKGLHGQGRHVHVARWSLQD